MSEALEIPLRNLRRWLEEETVPIVEPLKAEGSGLIDNVRDKLDDVTGACDKLLEDAEKEMENSGRKKYRRAKVTYKLAKNISEMIERVEFPEEISHESLHTLREDLEKVLDTITRERGKWFPVISPYFIIDRRRFDVALKRALDQLEELRFFSSDKYLKAEAVEDTFSVIDELPRLLSELGAAEAGKKKKELRKELLERKIAENQQKIIAIQSKSEVVELAKTDKNIEELEEKVKRNLRYFQKPFLKFQSLALGPSYSLPLEEADKLNEYLNRPFEALATEEAGYPLLKRILHRIEEALAQGKLKLKSSRMRKAKRQINNILHNDSLAPLHRSCKEAFSQKQSISTSGAIAASQRELNKLKKDLSELRRRKKMIDSRGVVLDNKVKEILKKIEEQKRDLEETILELTNRNVKVTFQANLD